MRKPTARGYGSVGLATLVIAGAAFYWGRKTKEVEPKAEKPAVVKPVEVRGN